VVFDSKSPTHELRLSLIIPKFARLRSGRVVGRGTEAERTMSMTLVRMNESESPRWRTSPAALTCDHSPNCPVKVVSEVREVRAKKKGGVVMESRPMYVPARR
jgi:hypothetical protein